MIIWEGCKTASKCIDIDDRVPVTFHPPMYKSAKEKIYIERSITFRDRWCCSKCGGEVLADGW
jgi:hypothetical protein